MNHMNSDDYTRHVSFNLVNVRLRMWFDSLLLIAVFTAIIQQHTMYPIVTYTQCIDNFEISKQYQGMQYLAQSKHNPYISSSHWNF